MISFTKHKKTLLVILLVGLFICSTTYYCFNCVETFANINDEIIECSKPDEGAIKTILKDKNGNDNEVIIPNGLSTNCSAVTDVSGLFLCGGETSLEQNKNGIYDDSCPKIWYVDMYGNVCKEVDNNNKCPGEPKIYSRLTYYIPFGQFMPTDVKDEVREPTDEEHKAIGNNYMLNESKKVIKDANGKFKRGYKLDLHLLTEEELTSLGKLVYDAYIASKNYIIHPEDDAIKEQLEDAKNKLIEKHEKLKEKAIQTTTQTTEIAGNNTQNTQQIQYTPYKSQQTQNNTQQTQYTPYRTHNGDFTAYNSIYSINL